MFVNPSVVYQIPEVGLLQAAQGGFQKQVLVVAAFEAGETGKTAFLEKILAAVGMNLHKDTLFALIRPNERVCLSTFLRDKQPQAVLVFGLAPTHLGLQAEFARYQPVRFYGAAFLWADSLATLEPDKALKGRLWTALQTMFLSQNG